MKLYSLFLLLSVSSLLLPLSSCTNTRRAATLHHIESIDSIMVKSLQSDTAYLNSRYSLTRQITVTKFRFDTIRKDWQPIRRTHIAMDEGLQLASTAATVSVSNTDSISTSSATSARTDTCSSVSDVTPTISSAVSNITTGSKWAQIIIGLAVGIALALAIYRFARKFT